MQPLFQEIKDLKVCILSEKLQVSQNISSYLRKHGIMPTFFDSIHSFWTSCLHQKIDIAIVDHSLLENSGVSLKDHPRIKNKQVNIIVSYDEPSLIRTDLLSNLSCLGLLTTTQGIEAQLSVLLQQARQLEELRLNSRQLVEHRERLRHRNALLVKNFEDSQKFCDEFMFMQNIVEQVDQKLELGFTNALETVFNELAFVKKFFIVGVNEKSDQLVSLSRDEKKSYRFQNLWVDSLHSGIHDKAFERILIQAQDQLGGDIIPIRIYSDLNKSAQILLVLSVPHKAQSLMPWRVLEEQLSARLSSTELAKRQHLENQAVVNQKQATFTSLWDLAQQLDTDQHQLTHKSEGLIEINLTGIISFINERADVRFFWSDFQRDFQQGLSRILGQETTLLENGIKSFILQTKRELLSQQLTLVEDFCEFFEYWRYFSDSHIVISHEFMPRVSILANTTKFLTQSFQPSKELEPTQALSPDLKNSESFSFDWDQDFAH